MLATTPFTKYSHVVERRRPDPVLRRAGRAHGVVRPARRDVPRPARRRDPRQGRRGRRRAPRRRIPPPPRSQASDADVEARARGAPQRRASARDRGQGHGVVARRGRGAGASSTRHTAAVPRLADGQGRRCPTTIRCRSAPARSHALQEADADPAARRPAQLDHALRPAPALRPGRARDPARHLRRAALDERPHRGRPRRRRQGRDGAAQRGARTPSRGRIPHDTPWRRSIAEKIESNRGGDRGDGRRRLACR